MIEKELRKWGICNLFYGIRGMSWWLFGGCVAWLEGKKLKYVFSKTGCGGIFKGLGLNSF